MAQTFTGKMFNLRNNSLKGAGNGSMPPGPSTSHKGSGSNINVQNFTQMQGANSSLRPTNVPNGSQQNPNVNLLLT